MTIGTAVPDAAQLSAVPHYFIQTESVTRLYSAGDYEVDALKLVRRLFDEGHERLVMSGGSMFYIDAVCRGLDDLPDAVPELRDALWAELRSEGIAPLAGRLRALDPVTAASIDLSNSQRVIRALEVCISTGKPFSSFKTGSVRPREFTIEKIGLVRPREELYRRIDARVLGMVERGLVDEVRGLADLRSLPALQTVGYQEIFSFLDGEYGLDEAVRLIQRNPRHYAKKQLTWWRRDPDIRWIDL